MRSEKEIKDKLQELKERLKNTPYEQKFSERDLIDSKIIALSFALGVDLVV